jgi:hypothetical protein
MRTGLPCLEWWCEAHLRVRRNDINDTAAGLLHPNFVTLALSRGPAFRAPQKEAGSRIKSGMTVSCGLSA